MQSSTDFSRARPFRIAWPIALFVLLFMFAIPWWWRFLPDLGSQTVLGAPVWFVTAVFGSALVSIASAYYLTVAWNSLDDEPELEEESSRE